MKKYVHVLSASPFRCHHEQRLPVFAPEHASEAAAVKLDRLQHLPTFVDAYTSGFVVFHGRRPNGTLRIEADSVTASAEFGPHASVRQATIGSDIERREPAGEGLCDDQRRVIGRHDHAVRKGDSVRNLANRTVRSDQCDDSRDELPTAEKIEVTPVDVGVTTTIHHDLVPAACEATQVGMGHQRPVWLPAQEKSLGTRYDKQAPIGEPVDGERDRGWDTGDYLAVALDIDGDDLLRAPVREPQTTLMPTRRLADHKTA